MEISRSERQRLSEAAWFKAEALMLASYSFNDDPDLPGPGSPAWEALVTRFARHIMWLQLQAYGRPCEPLPSVIELEVPQAAVGKLGEMLRAEAAKLN